MSWTELIITVPKSQKDSVVNRLFELGAAGVVEVESAGEVNVKASFEAVHAETVDSEFRSYLSSLTELFSGQPQLQFSWQPIVSEDWKESYKRHYFAQKLTPLFFLKPSWDADTEAPAEMIPIVMNPGQAFGTGLHATTRISLRLIEAAVNFYPNPGVVSLLDIGTGSGILAIAAHKLGIGRIGAIDNDPVAVEAAIENVEHNRCHGIELLHAEPAKIAGHYDIIVSNILLEAHVALAKDYARLLRRDGFLILSGVTVPHRNDLKTVMAEAGFVQEVALFQQEWMGATFIHRKEVGAL